MKDENDDLNRFAAERLNIHISELATRYNNEPVNKDTMMEAYSMHRNLFDEELCDKIDKILQPGNEAMKLQLEVVKQLYLDKLEFSPS